MFVRTGRTPSCGQTNLGGSYRWNPIESDDDLRTTVDFTLEAVGESTQLTIVESGFDKIPVGERDEAFRRNDGGWTMQVENIERHLSGN